MSLQERRVWSWFTACVLFLAAILGWLTWHSLSLERDRNEAQQLLAVGRAQLAQEERIQSAFWRVDSQLSLLLAREAARSPAEYSSFLDRDTVPNGAAEQSNVPIDHLYTDNLSPSPILETPSDFVRLHFQIGPDGDWSSPQCPVGDFNSKALACGVSESSIEGCSALLKQAESMVRFEQAVNLCLPVDNNPGFHSQPWLAEQNRPGPLGNKFETATGVPLWYGATNQPQTPPFNEATTPDQAEQQQQLDNTNQQLNYRANKDLESRAKISQSQVASAQVGNGFLYEGSNSELKVGMFRPVWLANQELVLIRRVQRGDQNLVQGCWLNWEQLKSFLKTEVADLFSAVDFVPVESVTDSPSARASTVLPIRISLPETSAREFLEPVEISGSGGAWPALVVAWLSAAAAAAAMAILLAGVLQLSARRATFVSAVSHELRTPLTTFRMYSEMLADGLIRDPVAQQEYLEILKSESERLGHLVDNVLDYAGLEQGVGKRDLQSLKLRDLIQRIAPVLQRMAENGGVRLLEKFSSGALDATVHSDIAAIERVLINLVDNAIKYGRSPDSATEIQVVEWTAEGPHDGKICISIRDFGPGVPLDRQRKMFTPFSRSDSEAAGSAPGVGLGLALCHRIAGKLGLELIYSSASPGSRFTLKLPVARAS